MRILILSDHDYIYRNMKKIVKLELYGNHLFQFMFSHNNTYFIENYKNNEFLPINLKASYKKVLNGFDLIISAFCRQIFPSEIVNNVRCINIHPGFNPYNRGVSSQAFSIINKLPIGVTIHEMDEFIDHGPIIIQKAIKIEEHDTSFDVYKKILHTTIVLIKENLISLIEGKYSVFYPPSEGNLNQKRDFYNMLEVDMDKPSTYREVVDFLRAMTFKGYDNAFFYNENGEKVFLEIKLKRMRNQ